jgi:hypothetical protein
MLVDIVRGGLPDINQLRVQTNYVGFKEESDPALLKSFEGLARVLTSTLTA